jgi:hypothetical protein
MLSGESIPITKAALEKSTFTHEMPKNILLNNKMNILFGGSHILQQRSDNGPPSVSSNLNNFELFFVYNFYFIFIKVPWTPPSNLLDDGCTNWIFDCERRTHSFDFVLSDRRSIIYEGYFYLNFRAFWNRFNWFRLHHHITLNSWRNGCVACSSSRVWYCSCLLY